MKADPQTKKPPLGWLFGNYFGNSSVVCAQTFKLPIDLAETKAAIDQNQHLPSLVIILVFMRVTEEYLHQPHPTDIIQIQI